MTEKRYPIKRQSSLWKLWIEGLFKKNYNFKYRWLEIQNSQESFWLLSHSIFMWRWIEFILINVPLWSSPPLVFSPFHEHTNKHIYSLSIISILHLIYFFLEAVFCGERTLVSEFKDLFSFCFMTWDDLSKSFCFSFVFLSVKWGQLPWWLSGKESACRRHGFNPWVRKFPWRRKWQPTPVYLPGKSHGQRSLMGYSP